MSTSTATTQPRIKPEPKDQARRIIHRDMVTVQSTGIRRVPCGGGFRIIRKSQKNN